MISLGSVVFSSILYDETLRTEARFNVGVKREVCWEMCPIVLCLNALLISKTSL